MAVKFSESKTKENLMKAFAGESQARNRYTIAADIAKEKGMLTIADIFLYTADQERAHAERYYELLKDLSGESIHIDGTYPVDLQEELSDLLRAAERNEREEYRDIYPDFGDIAQNEGFLEAASAFYQIAEIEHTHEERFAHLAEMLENNTYYASTETSVWLCTNCGYIHEGIQAPNICPVCRYKRGYFIPWELACYKV